MSAADGGGAQVVMPAGSASAEGTVFDIGYERYTGPREGRWRSRLAVYKDGVRAVLGLGRSGRSKILPWFFICLLGIIGLVLALIAGAAYIFAGPDAAGALNIPSHSDFNGIASIIFFVFAAVRAPELLCPDRRQGVISLYLVRPLTGTDYVFSRWLAFFTVMAGVAWFPQVILLIGLVMGDPDPGRYFLANWLDIPRFLAAGAVFAAYTTSLAMFTASFTTRRAYASVFLIGLFLITTPVTTGLATYLGDTPVGEWISMFNLTNVPVHVNDLIFGEVSGITSAAPARQLPPSLLIGWCALWTGLPTLVLWRRYRRFVP
jgi:ABC-2 type transport system permease protein